MTDHLAFRTLVGSTLYRLGTSSKRVNLKIYNGISARIKAPEFTFINLGYEAPDSAASPLVLNADDALHRQSIQLYHQVIGDVRLEGKDVLEVGCGRGGGSAYLARTFKLGSMTAIDISSTSIEFCRSTHASVPVRFKQADAEALPFTDQSFDVLINIESSHLYPSMNGPLTRAPLFLKEVRRVLRPEGYFLFADMRFRPRDLDDLKTRLQRAQLRQLREEDILEGVIRARQIVSRSPAYQQALRRWAAQANLGARGYQRLCRGLWLEGTSRYRLLTSGAVSYRIWTLQRAAWKHLNP